MPRLFTAIEIPDDIGEELHRLHMPLPGARWIKPENYHITLRFAGDIGNTEAREFIANLAHIETDGFELRLSGLGVFGGDDPHAIWASVAPEPQLDELARDSVHTFTFVLSPLPLFGATGSPVRPLALVSAP